VFQNFVYKSLLSATFSLIVTQYIAFLWLTPIPGRQKWVKSLRISNILSAATSGRAVACFRISLALSGCSAGLSNRVMALTADGPGGGV
jgi:hypothetical protein